MFYLAALSSVSLNLVVFIFLFFRKKICCENKQPVKGSERIFAHPDREVQKWHPLKPRKDFCTNSGKMQYSISSNLHSYQL